MSKVKEIEYQNSLVMMSLEKYNEKYEGLKKEQTELLEIAKEKIELLQTNNLMMEEVMNQQMKQLNKKIILQLDQLNQKSNQEIGTLRDRSEKLIKNIENKINSTYKENTEMINKKIIETVDKCEELQ